MILFMILWDRIVRICILKISDKYISLVQMFNHLALISVCSFDLIFKNGHEHGKVFAFAHFVANGAKTLEYHPATNVNTF